MMKNLIIIYFFFLVFWLYGCELSNDKNNGESINQINNEEIPYQKEGNHKEIPEYTTTPPLTTLNTNWKNNCEFEQPCKGFLFIEDEYDCPRNSHNICIIHQDYTFPIIKYKLFTLPNKELLSWKKRNGERPVYPNHSYIFFENEWNNSETITNKDNYSIHGKIMNNVEVIEVIRDKGKEPYILKNFTLGNKDFTYNISFKLGNISYGENNYLIRWYAGDKIYERVFSIFLIDENAETKELVEIAHKEKKYGNCMWEGLLCWSKKCLGNYSKQSISNAIIYHLGFDDLYFGPQKLSFDNGYTLIYQNIFKKDERSPGKLQIFSPEGTKAEIEARLFCWWFEQPLLWVYNDGVIIIKMDGRESAHQRYIYLPKTNELLNFHTDYMEKNLGDDAYYFFSFQREWDTITTQEENYCCDYIEDPNGHEKIIYGLFNKEVISRTPLE